MGSVVLGGDEGSSLGLGSSWIGGAGVLSGLLGGGVMIGSSDGFFVSSGGDGVSCDGGTGGCRTYLSTSLMFSEGSTHNAVDRVLR